MICDRPSGKAFCPSRKITKIRLPGNENDQFQKHQMILYCEIFLFRFISIFFFHSLPLFFLFFSSFRLRFMSTIHLSVLLCAVICSTVACALMAVGAARTRIILCIEFSVSFFLPFSGSGAMAINIKNQRCAPLVLGILLLILPFLPATNLFVTVGFVVAERVLYIPR